MKDLTLIGLLMVALCPALLVAQPLPCGPNPQMTSFCNDACIICDIDGFTGINLDNIVGQAPPGFCTGTVHHMKWIGFIAGSVNLTLKLDVFNCQQGEGLEVGIYKSLDCQTFQLVSNCDTDIPNNTSQNFTNTVPLVIGQHYYFVMDGGNDDVCNWKISVVNGTTKVLQLPPSSGELEGDFTVCPGRTEKYALHPPVGAAQFDWTLDGQNIASGIDTVVTLNWTAPGQHQLCAAASNVCDASAPVCRTVTVAPVPDTLIELAICDGDCVQVADTTICGAGFWTFHFEGAEGCDSIVRVKTTVLPTKTTTLDLLICDGDSVFVAGKPYFKAGTFKDTLLSVNGCDSSLVVHLQTIICEIKGKTASKPTDCYGNATGQLAFWATSATPPLHYSWEKIGPGFPKGNGSLSALTDTARLTGLPSGTYSITVLDDFGNDAILFGYIKEPEKLKLDLSSPLFNGFAIACQGDSTGRIMADRTGGTPPFDFAFSNGQNGPSALLKNLSAGAYACTVTDGNGCSAIDALSLNEPAALVLDAVFSQPTCNGPNDGAASALSTSGGAEPYRFKIDGGAFDSLSHFDNLAPGLRTLTVRDANGCETSRSDDLIRPIIPQIEIAGPLEILLGDSVELEIRSNEPLDSFVWSGAEPLSCYDCPQPWALAVRSASYAVEAFAPGLRCADTASVAVRVLERRRVFAPSAFTPDDDGLNDRFLIYGGPEVRQIRTFQVFSRWGELLFERKNIQPNDETQGWDGAFRGKKLPAGPVVWRAEIEFIDGISQELSGDVTLAH